MKMHIRMKLLLVVVVGSLVNMYPVPARAAATAEIVGVFGGESTSTALCNPLVCSGTPFDGRTGTWVMNAPAGLVNVGTGFGWQVGAPPVAFPRLTVTLHGSLGGVAGTSMGVGAWCGLSGGWDGIGTVRVGNQPFAGDIIREVDDVGWLASAGNLMILTNATTAPGSPLIFATVSFLPVGGTGSCLTGQSTFQVVGNLKVVDP